MNIQGKFKEKELKFNHYYSLEKDSAQITSLKFYLSNIKFLYQGKVKFTSKAYYLVDLSKDKMVDIEIPKHLKFDAIIIGVGIDSTKSVSGVFGGDLDPQNGMYWAWNSGYINWKLEGNSNLSTKRKQSFIYHIGGYDKEQNCYVEKEFVLKGESLNLELKLEKLLENLFSENFFLMMTPGEDSKKCNQYFLNALVQK